MSEDTVKAAVRERDGRCTVCGLTNAEHVEQCGRQLDVHRVTPGSPYTVGGCVAVCRGCHGEEHNRLAPPPRGETPRVAVRVSAETLADLDYVAEKTGRPTTRTDAIRIAAREAARARRKEKGA